MAKRPTYFDVNKLCPHYPGKCASCQHKTWCWKYHHGDEIKAANSNSVKSF